MSPYLTHPATALLRYAATFLVLRLLRVPFSEFFAMANTVGLYEGREAGQREHDLKSPVVMTRPWSAVWAWLGAFLFFGWSLANVAQALAGIVPVVAVACLLHFLGL